MKYQFKEGDGSHRDMTIEQCNLVLDRLRKQGYEASGEPCNKQYPHFWFNSGDFYRVFSTRDSPLTSHNEIPFERWMEILDSNDGIYKMEFQNGEGIVGTQMGAGDDYPVTEYVIKSIEYPTLRDQLINIDGISEAIKEHQRQCKAAIMDCGGSEIIKNQIIYEMKEVLTHISENQLAGYPEKLRKLAEKLVNM